MAKSKSSNTSSDAAGDARRIGRTVMDSAQQIWLAGLGAFAKAQEEGGKLFDSLVKEGAALDAKTRKFTEGRMDEMRGNVESTFDRVRERSQETWDKLEKAFEARVARAMARHGVPDHEEMKTLTLRVEELAREVRHLGNKAAPVKRPAAKRARKQVPKKRLS